MADSGRAHHGPAHTTAARAASSPPGKHEDQIPTLPTQALSTCRICHTDPARPGRRDQRCPTCAAYYHRYGQDRTEQLIIRNNIRQFERSLPVQQ